MKTTFDILDVLYPIIHVTSVNTLLDGRVWRTAKPPNRTVKDVVLLTLPILESESSIIQECPIVINCYAPNVGDQPDEGSIKTITDMVINKLEMFSTANTYYNIQITSQSLFSDQDNPNMSYGSIRADIQIQSE
jgi:hypothetical protein